MLDSDKIMHPTLLLSFLGASIILSLMPGPDNIFVLTESATKGARNGIAITCGLCCGILLHTTAMATGLSLILTQSTVLFSIVQYCGAAYLCYLAYRASQESAPSLELAPGLKSSHYSLYPLVKKGFLANALNPKVSLFFIAFLPRFIDPASELPISLQIAILGILFMLQAFFIFSGIALASGKLTPLTTKPKFWSITQLVTVIVLLGLGLSLAFSHP